MSQSELEGALGEIQGFLDQAKHERVIKILKKAESSLKAELEAVPKPLISENPKQPEKMESTPVQRITYQSFSSFSWDQNNTHVTIYFLDGLEGVEKLPRENVLCSFQKNQVELCIHGLKGRNYRWIQSMNITLNRNIHPSESKILIRKNRITLKLMKEHPNETWIQLDPEKKKFDLPRENDDPGASLMSLMKNMYETGDDEMKRTIAEAYTKAQSGEMPSYANDLNI